VDTGLNLLEVGQRVLLEEGVALGDLAQALDETFERAVKAILDATAQGKRVITCGVGKSGHIARKTAGTLASTGTPSLFLHAAEAMHGDLGMVNPGEIVILYSHSGETDEIVNVFLPLKANGANTILITGRKDSSAARLADIVLTTGVTKEACPNNLAPTTSTTAMLALSDALAVAAMEARGFTPEDFAKFHPSGALGKRLLLTVADVMRKGADVATVRQDTGVLDILKAITQANAGAAIVVSEDGVMLGFISEGDLRRHMVSSANPLEGTAKEIMKEQVTTIPVDLLAIEALEVFQNHPVKFGEAPVLDENRKLLGVLVLKDLLRSGIL
jgi:arabinose-5-phosphate isomerase